MRTHTLKPAALKPGDKIGIISPASPMSSERLELGMKYLNQKGYETSLGKHVRDMRGYLAGTDEDRLKDIHSFFSDQSVKAIFSSRGGYGTSRLIDSLDYDLVKSNPKILMGYSDLTAIQLAIWQRTGLITFSGPMVAVEMGQGIDDITENIMWSTLNTGRYDAWLSSFPGESLKIINHGIAKGPLLGGCLSVVMNIIGTEYQPNFDDAILVLEDIGEEPYRIDRYLSQLRLAGILDQISGVIIAQFLDCDAEPGKPSLTIEEVILDYFSSRSIPVVSGLKYGHLPQKYTLPLGATLEIDTAIPSFRFPDSVVAAE